MTELTARQETDRRTLARIRRDLGEEIYARLHDRQVTEILLNQDLSVWEDRLGWGLSRVGTMTAEAASSFLRTIASELDVSIDKSSPSLSCEIGLLRNARLEATVWPLSPQPQFAIRIPAIQIYTLADYERDGIMTRRQRAVIEDALGSDLNVLVAGGTGTGKTTLVNACLHTISVLHPDHRLVILEQAYELQPSSANVARLKTTEALTHNDLIRICMRLRPDRIIIGEVRGPEALALLKVSNTGHHGTLSTLHADRALTRLEDLIAEATTVDKRSEIANSFHLIVQMGFNEAHERRVKDILRVEGFHEGNYVLTHLGNVP